MKKINVTIIGFGTIGRAIAEALRKKDHLVKISAVDKDGKNLSSVRKSDFAILAVKPQDAPEAIEGVKNHGLHSKTILISIMAGFPIKKIIRLSGHPKIVRLMPNLGLSVGAGIAAWKQSGLSKPEASKVKNFINKITENFEVEDEKVIDKVTAISGSGPAYFLLLAESLVRTSKNLGLSEQKARTLVEKTLLASALLSKGGADYRTLIEKIACKKGMTEKALEVFKKNKFDKIVSRAVVAAYKRASEIARP